MIIHSATSAAIARFGLWIPDDIRLHLLHSRDFQVKRAAERRELDHTDIAVYLIRL